jgi:multidrug resistance efflux pump
MKLCMLKVLMLVAIPALASCRDGAEPANNGAAAAASPPQTNRVDIPDAVRQNLGITFAKVEKRRITQTMRAPGRFELTPQARHEYRSTLSGRIEFLVSQYQQVEAGTPVYRIDSPEWPEVQREISDGLLAITTAENEKRAADAAVAEQQAKITLVRNRITALAEAEVRRVELEQQAAELETAIPRLATDVEIKRANIAAAQHRLDHVIRRASALLGMTESALLEHVSHEGKERPRWEVIDRIEVTAIESGVVQSLDVTPGGWVETSGLVLTIINPQKVRFRATGLQADLSRLRTGLPALIYPPTSDSDKSNQPLAAELTIGLEADASQRTIELLAIPQTLADWTRPGVSAFLEVETSGTSAAELVVPRSSIVQDGLDHVLFRRDPNDPNKAIRMAADMGMTDGHWVVINSGLKIGDEVVLNGVYELKLATSGQTAKGGHFHADGTFHAEH